MRHIDTRRLFDTSRIDLGEEFELEDWEFTHLKECKECQHIKEVFARQFKALNLNQNQNWKRDGEPS